MEYYSFNQYMKDRFGCKVYKIAINGGFTCPNRDGTIDTRGCIFCSESGSGNFAENPLLSVYEQIEEGKKRVKNKISSGKYIAYFQAFTNTYGNINRLEELYMQAISHPEIVALSIGTRPDCLPDDVLDLIERLNQVKPVWIELGLQTIHEKTASYIRRGYELSVFENALVRLQERNIEVIVHLILGLPGESIEDIKASVDYVGKKQVNGVKLQLLHVLKDTDLCRAYENKEFSVFSMEEYVKLVTECIAILPENMVIHRMTGDGDKNSLIAPLWSGDKKRVMNALQKSIQEYERI